MKHVENYSILLQPKRNLIFPSSAKTQLELCWLTELALLSINPATPRVFTIQTQPFLSLMQLCGIFSPGGACSQKSSDLFQDCQIVPQIGHG